MVPLCLLVGIYSEADTAIGGVTVFLMELDPVPYDSVSESRSRELVGAVVELNTAAAELGRSVRRYVWIQPTHEERTA
jgi:hypothetical protein